MKSVTLMAAFLAIFAHANAQLDTSGPRVATGTEAQEIESVELSDDEVQKLKDSIHATFKFQTGKVTLEHGIVINVPKGFRYLDATQSHRVLEDLWENPKSETMGMLFPEDRGPLDDNTWAFDINFEEMGYVKDEDADKIDYDDLLKTMKEEAVEANKTRAEGGYESINIIGWAAAPYYDKTTKTLHWARELKFGESEQHTLNYNVRILGRKGVLSMNAIGAMPQLAEIKTHIPAILNSASFESGHAYADFNPDVDEVAAWTVGGLVAGKVLAKVGFFAILAKFGKFIVLGVIALGGAAYKWITGRRRKEEEVQAEEQPEPLAAGEEVESESQTKA